MGASLIIAIDGDETRLAMARRMGANVVLDYRAVDVLAEVKRLTGGGADVAIEALGTQQTFESALRCLRPGGTLSSLGVYSGKLQMPYDAFSAGLGDHRIVTTLCPGGKERMRRLLSLVQSGRFDPTPLITHRFSLDEIPQGYTDSSASAQMASSKWRSNRRREQPRLDATTSSENVSTWSQVLGSPSAAEPKVGINRRSAILESVCSGAAEPQSSLSSLDRGDCGASHSALRLSHESRRVSNSAAGHARASAAFRSCLSCSRNFCDGNSVPICWPEFPSSLRFLLGRIPGGLDRGPDAVRRRGA